jgi:1-acyl-sn-glycerol-3-phosphate acyltransferase
MTEQGDGIVPERLGASAKVKVGVGLGIALAAGAIGSFVVFRLMNRIKAEGLENIPLGHSNVLYCLNHNSLLDTFAFESVACFPRVLLEPEYLPVNLADRNNFFGDPVSRRLKDRVLRLLGRHFFTHLRAYPVVRGEGDLDQVDAWAELLSDNVVIVFPEGTRSRTGEIGPGKAGVGKLIYVARPTVIPVRMWGMEKVLGVGRLVPRAFQTVHLKIGRALDMSDLLDRPLPRDRAGQLVLYRTISNRAVDAIRALASAK